VPVNVGLFQNIKAVAWNVGTKFVTIQTRQTQAGSLFGTSTLFNLPGSTVAIDLSAPGDVVRSLGNPPKEYVHKVDPLITSEDLEVLATTCNGFVIVNIKTATNFLPPDKKFQFKVSIPEVGRTQFFPGGTIYWLWGDQIGATSFAENLAHPYTTGDPFSGYPITDPRSIMFLPRPFGSEADRAPYLSVGGGDFHAFDEAFGGGTFTQDGSYRVDIATYNHRKTFPLDANRQPLWNTAEAVSAGARNISGHGLGGFNITVTIDPNLTVHIV
jgi:hypothetical protein